MYCRFVFLCKFVLLDDVRVGCVCFWGMFDGDLFVIVGSVVGCYWVDGVV